MLRCRHPGEGRWPLAFIACIRYLAVPIFFLVFVTPLPTGPRSGISLPVRRHGRWLRVESGGDRSTGREPIRATPAIFKHRENGKLEAEKWGICCTCAVNRALQDPQSAGETRPSDWVDRTDRVHTAGFTTVQTHCMSWGRREPASPFGRGGRGYGGVPPQPVGCF
jgi:hypothetical protein